MHSKIKTIGASLALLGAAAGGVFALTSLSSAVDHTVGAGQTIQSVIDAAAAGDTVIIPAGEYNESLNIRKSLTVRGEGNVVINTQSTSNKGVDLQDTTNVTLENLTFDGNNSTSPTQTGVDINSARDVVLSNITIRNYSKNGIAVTTQFAPEYVAGGNITFNNVDVTGAAWAGIAFYTGVGEPVSDVQFTGTTVIADTQYGIQFGDGDNSGEVTGTDGTPVSLGQVVFTGNTANVSNDDGTATYTVASNSTIDGVPVTAADFENGNVTIVAPAAEGEEGAGGGEDLGAGGGEGAPAEGGTGAAGEDTVIPGVPNTGVVN